MSNVKNGYCEEYAPQDTFSGDGGHILHKRIFAQLKNPPPKIYMIIVDKYICVHVDNLLC